ncbi:MAG: hypothetical protein CVU87_11800 [Firmicutes bacterium HGW-Firmicutes-12]|jgi:hypothetical protein|nr:MAG: hypothetical protein CVU87_11800 [Firmicutes bacterium HGW-Firmicutes-12]
MGYSYRDWEKALTKADFNRYEGANHIIFKKIDSNGTIRTVPIRRKGVKEIPKGFHYDLLKEAGMTQSEFEFYLKGKKRH